MLVISIKINECANTEIEAAAMLILLVTGRQSTMPGFTESKPATPLVSIAVDIWVSILFSFKARQLFVTKKAGKLFNRSNQHKPHNSILPSTLRGKSKIQT